MPPSRGSFLMSDDDKVVPFPATPDRVADSVADVFASLADYAQAGNVRGIAYAMIDDEGAMIRESSISDSPGDMFLALSMLQFRIMSQLAAATETD